MGQILVTNQRLNKISAARVHLVARGMLKGPSSTTGIISGLHSGLTNHEQPFNELGSQCTQRIRPATARHSESKHDTDSAFWNHERHDSRAEDDPKANAEISLLKTYGAYFFRIFRLHSLRFFPVRNLPHNVFQLAQKIDQPKLPQLVRRFLYGVLYPNLPTPIADLAPDDLSLIPENLKVYTCG